MRVTLSQMQATNFWRFRPPRGVVELRQGYHKRIFYARLNQHPLAEQNSKLYIQQKRKTEQISSHQQQIVTDLVYFC